jgi:hypothetical protein
VLRPAVDIASETHILAAATWNHTSVSHNWPSLLLLLLLHSYAPPNPQTHQPQDLASVLAAEYPQGVDIVYEGVGGAVRAAIMPHLAPGARLLQVGYISGAGYITNNTRVYDNTHRVHARYRAVINSTALHHQSLDSNHFRGQ